MFKTKIRTAVAILAAAAAVMTVGLSAAPANAAIGPMTAKLTVTPYKPGYHNVAVFGLVKMSQGEAQSLLNSGHRIVMRLWGEDVFYDDLLIGPYSPQFGPAATAQGLEFHRVMIGVNDNVLDEDPEGADELYVGARLVRPGGSTIKSVTTNRVTGRF
jgi:TctA family transporter